MSVGAGSKLALLLLAWCCYVAKSDVYIISHAYNWDPLPDLPADFGPDVPELGIEGLLRSAEPEDACTPLRFQDFQNTWIALISRQQQYRSINCTFDVKVRNAQEAGAVAAIVYDDVYESLIIMSKPRGHPDPLIPSVFVTEKAGIIMKKLMTLDDIRVRITPVSAIAWISMVMSAFLGLLALTVVIATFYVMRSWSMWLGQGRHRTPVGPPTIRPGAQHESGLTPSSLRALPVIIYESGATSRQTSMDPAAAKGLSYSGDVESADDSGSCRGGSSNSSECEAPLPGVHAGETKRVCAICLEHYVDGEKIRVLPCHHRFHVGCVDQWLSSRRSCPVCKHHADKPLLPPPPPTDASGGSASSSAARRRWWWNRSASMPLPAQNRSSVRTRLARLLGLRPHQDPALQPLLPHTLALHAPQAAEPPATHDRWQPRFVLDRSGSEPAFMLDVSGLEEQVQRIIQRFEARQQWQYLDQRGGATRAAAAGMEGQQEEPQQQLQQEEQQEEQEVEVEQDGSQPHPERLMLQQQWQQRRQQQQQQQTEPIYIYRGLLQGPEAAVSGADTPPQPPPRPPAVASVDSEISIVSESPVGPDMGQSAPRLGASSSRGRPSTSRRERRWRNRG